MALTGLTSGMAANMTRPAAAIDARTTVGMTCRMVGRDESYPAKKKPRQPMVTSIIRAAVAGTSKKANAIRATGTKSRTNASTAWPKPALFPVGLRVTASPMSSP